MKKCFVFLILFVSIILLVGCNQRKNNKIVYASLDDNGDIIVDKEEITKDATYIVYKTEDINIGLIAVRTTDDVVKVVFNTCQSCSPSPNAYFVQKGEYFVCQNCGTKFHIDELGEKKYGCNPLVVEEQIEESGIIMISKDYVEKFKDNFKNWQGPIV